MVHPRASRFSMRNARGTAQPLDPLFAPKSIALIGASDKPGSVGRALAENLRTFDGPTYFVNPNHREILGIKTFATVASIPDRIDLAVIATPAHAVPEIMRQCVSTKVGGAVILSAGFKECGAQGVALENRVVAEARRGTLRLLGPNCLGAMIPSKKFNATFAGAMAHPGSVAFLSQSGALCTAILDWSLRENVGFSAFVSMGSMADVGWGDLITYFGDDPHTRSIVCYMESVTDARSFLSAAREVALNKPIIVLKVGRTEAAAKAAASHTGALTGSDTVLDAAFRRVGILRVNTLGELFDMAEVLAKQPRPRGPRLAIVTNAGGPGALATDMVVFNGCPIAQLSPAIVEALDRVLPTHWSHSNPIDILGDADPVRYANAVDSALRDSQTDAVLAILTPQAMTDGTGTAKQLSRITKDSAKPILASWMGGISVDEGRAILNAANVPTFDTPDMAARAFGLMWQYSDNLRALYETPSPGPSDLDFQARRVEAEIQIEKAVQCGRTLLTEVESKQILAAYSIPVIETRAACSEDDAVRQAELLGFPVVVKLFSKTLTHKSDVGGVHLDVRNPNAVRHAWRTIEQSVKDRAGLEHFLGVTVQPMVARRGFELILGSSVDPQFGPVLMFGTGGNFVEVFKDTVLGLPPLNATLARRMMERTRIYDALKGVRGGRPADLPALEQLLVRFSQLVADQPWISEIDINPLLVSDDQMLALDARIVLHAANTPKEQLPHPAIPTYPVRYIKPWILKDGTPVTIRPICPEDEPAMIRFHQTLSDRSVYFRYFSSLKLDQRVGHERLSRICFIDYDREMALVVEARDKNNKPEIVGVGRLSRLHGVKEAEFALIVTDEWQGQGIGSELLKRIVQIGRDEKLERITAIMLPDNHAMHRLARKTGFTVTQEPGAGESFAEIFL
jgi:acetyltransferase